MSAKTRSPLLVGVVAASTHLVILALACAISLIASQGFMGGPFYYFFHVLWIADLPLSIFLDMLIFFGHPVVGLALWAVLGTVWWFGLGAVSWYFVGEMMQTIQTRLRRDMERIKMDGQREPDKLS